ncbi:iron utilization protein [Bordetella pertussis]|nr:iron utilization protein [Bordetella pertussis]CFL96542.1 iron utilization protein [Bordetella pertussis]CFM31952.1 iron utilization protein [Bordetella pertussis]CFM66886.1 iron utilization protein [Bordetella pertussis]CFN13405.1 iron utilization protein [Bordetella pertussis]
MRALRLPPGEGYAWAAAEAAVARAVRQALVDTHGLDKSRIRAASYWKRGEAAVHETHD